MKITVFADLHYIKGCSIKAQILDNAICEAELQNAAIIVCAGDMLGTGTIRDAEELASIFKKHTIPVAFTFGNAELRTPSDTNAIRHILISDPLPDGIVLLDSSNGCCDSQTIGKIRGHNLLAITHVPPSSWCNEAYSAWQNAVRDDVISLTVAGHTHEDLSSQGLSVIRGLDPDKAIGGPPAFALYENDANGWHQSGLYEIPAIRPAEWDRHFREDFISDLGFSAMQDPFGGVDFAIENNVGNLEFRNGSWLPEDFSKLCRKTFEWHTTCGKCLSLHLPSISFEHGNASGIERLRDACISATQLGCNRVTLHVPLIHVSKYDANKQLIRDSFDSALSPLKNSGIKIGVENMHMTSGDFDEFNRHFGYTPKECKTQIELLKTIDGLDIGFHCDIGHARNNAPFSSRFPISTWYEALGSEFNGMHLHQVKLQPDGTMSNHKPLDSFFGSLISLSSLIYARQNGILPRVPMFLEIREGRGPECYRKLTQL